MKTLDYVPDGLNDILEYYGNPDRDDNFAPDRAFEENALVWVKAPYDLFLPWRLHKPCEWIFCHRLVAESLLDALEEIESYHGGDYVDTHDLDRYGGMYHFRKMHSVDALSTHSWGIAIDLNPDRAGWGADPATQPEFIVEAFVRRGWNWGGHWPPKYTSDPMHFQACTGY